MHLLSTSLIAIQAQSLSSFPSIFILKGLSEKNSDGDELGLEDGVNDDIFDGKALGFSDGTVLGNTLGYNDG